MFHTTRRGIEGSTVGPQNATAAAQPQYQRTKQRPPMCILAGAYQAKSAAMYTRHRKRRYSDAAASSSQV